jgi:hypothetical protein
MSITHKELVVYHINRDSTAIPAKEKVIKKQKTGVSDKRFDLKPKILMATLTDDFLHDVLVHQR